MDYSWNGLADRCQLFTDAERPLLIELLKEAQSEISNECMLYDAIFTYVGSELGLRGNRKSNFGVLPTDYLQDIGVWCNGTPLKKMSEKDFYYTDNGATDFKRNDPDDGDPSFYYISGGHIQFDSNPNSTDHIMLYYKARIISSDVAKLTYFKVNRDGIVDIPMNYRSDLNGLTLKGENFQYTNIQYLSQVQQSFPKLLDPYYYNTSHQHDSDNVYPLGVTSNRYTTSQNTTELDDNLRMAHIIGFGGKAPVIPSEYHLSLCDYAIAIASAKNNPEMHDKHFTIWNARIEDVKNKDADKDLMFNIREVV